MSVLGAFSKTRQTALKPEDFWMHAFGAAKATQLLCDGPCLVKSPDGCFTIGLLHDLGKALTPQREWPSHIRHEQRGVPLVKKVCDRLRTPTLWRDLAVKVTGLHLRSHRSLEMKPSTIYRLLEEGDFLRRPDMISEFTLACEADCRGRTGLEDVDYPQAQFLQDALEAVMSVQARNLDIEGLSGKQVGRLLRSERLAWL